MWDGFGWMRRQDSDKAGDGSAGSAGPSVSPSGPGSFGFGASGAGLRRRLAGYLLRQTAGRLLAGGVDWDGLEVQLGAGGRVELHGLALDADVVNRALGHCTDGTGRPPWRLATSHIGTLRIAVPWSGFFAEPCSVEIEDLRLELVPSDCHPGDSNGDDGATDTHEQQNQQQQPRPLMSSSFHFADGFLRSELSEDDPESPPPGSPALSPSSMHGRSGNHHDTVTAAGLSDLARIIENIIGKVTVSLTRVVCTITTRNPDRVEHDTNHDGANDDDDTSVLELSCRQISLCNHTTNDVQRLIPSWLQTGGEPALNQIFKYLRIVGLVVSTIPNKQIHPSTAGPGIESSLTSSSDACPLISTPEGWLRILFKQDNLGGDEHALHGSGIAGTSGSLWTSGFEIAGDFDRLGILLHTKTAENVIRIFQNAFQFMPVAHDASPSQSQQQKQQQDSSPASHHPPEPFLFTLRVGSISTCVFHAHERMPTMQDMDAITVRKHQGQSLGDDAQCLDVQHMRLDLSGLALRLQHHTNTKGQAIGIDITLDTLLLRYTDASSPSSTASTDTQQDSASTRLSLITLLHAMHSHDIPDSARLSEFLLKKMNPSPVSPGFSISQNDTLQVRIEGFKQISSMSAEMPAAAGDAGNAKPPGWGFHFSAILPPLSLAISTAKISMLQQYVRGYHSLFSQDRSFKTNVNDKGKVRQGVTFSVACPFVRVVVEVKPPGANYTDLVHAVIDVFSAKIDTPGSDDTRNNLGPDVSAGFVLLSLTTDPCARELRPLVLWDTVRLDLTDKHAGLVPPGERFEETISSLHRLYREHAPTVEDIAARSWSDIHEEGGGRGPKIAMGEAMRPTDTNAPRFWADTQSKHRRNHPFAALSATVLTIDCLIFDVHVSDLDLSFVRRIIAQAQALNASQQETVPFPRVAALFMSTAATLKFTLHQTVGQTQRVDLAFRELDAIVAVGSVGKSRNTLAVELIAGKLDLAFQRFLIDTDYHEQTVVCHPTHTGSIAPMLRLVFSQMDDFDVCVRQTMVTTVVDHVAVHLPFEINGFVDLVADAFNIPFQSQQQLMQPPPPSSSPSTTHATDLESFASVHVTMSNFHLVHVSSQPFRGTLLFFGNRLRIATNIVHGSPTRLFDVSLTDGSASISLNADAGVLLSKSFEGDAAAAGAPSGNNTSSSSSIDMHDMQRHLLSLGFVRVMQVDLLRLLVRLNSGDILPKSEVDVTVGDVQIDAFADSLSTVLGYIDALEHELRRSMWLTRNPPSDDYDTTPSDIPDSLCGSVSGTPEDPALPLSSSQQPMINIFDQVDETAFKRNVTTPISTRNSDARSTVLEQQDSSTTDHDWQMNFESVPVSMPANMDDDAVNAGVMNEPVTETVRSNCNGVPLSPNSASSLSTTALHIEHGYLDRIESELRDASVCHSHTTLPQSTFRLRECNIVCRLYEGSHWDFEREQLAQSKRGSNVAGGGVDDKGTGHEPFSPSQDSDLFSGADYESFVGMGIGVGVAASADTHIPNAGRTRDEFGASDDSMGDRPTDPRAEKHELELRFVRVVVRLDTFPKSNPDCTRELDISIRDIEIIDHVRTSQWRKFFTYMQPESNMLPRETGSDMLNVWLRSAPQCSGLGGKNSNIRHNTDNTIDEETRLQATLLPFRMYIDQDTLKFAIRFVYETMNLRPPLVETVSLSSNAKTPANATPNTSTDKTFFQYVEIDPIQMKIDYKPKHVDFSNLKDGNLIEILNFISFDSAEMSLHRIRLAGVKGWGNLARRVLGVWLPYIRDTQVPHVASGVSSVRPLVNVGAGLADLVLLPVEQFRRDGRIVKGLQKGTGAFLRAATMETIRLGSRLAAGTQVILERAEELVAGGTGAASGSGQATDIYIGASDDRWGDDASSSASGYTGDSGGDSASGNSAAAGRTNRRRVSKFAEQPRDIREGLQMGYTSLSEGVRSAARTIFAVPTEVYETNEEGRVHPVVRAVPVAILQPMIGATDAVSKTLVGLQNTLDRTQQKRMEDKYKRPN